MVADGELTGYRKGQSHRVIRVDLNEIDEQADASHKTSRHERGNGELSGQQSRLLRSDGPLRAGADTSPASTTPAGGGRPGGSSCGAPDLRLPKICRGHRCRGCRWARTNLTPTESRTADRAVGGRGPAAHAVPKTLLGTARAARRRRTPAVGRRLASAAVQQHQAKLLPPLRRPVPERGLPSPGADFAQAGVVGGCQGHAATRSAQRPSLDNHHRTGTDRPLRGSLLGFLVGEPLATQGDAVGLQLHVWWFSVVAGVPLSGRGSVASNFGGWGLRGGDGLSGRRSWRKSRVIMAGPRGCRARRSASLRC